MRGNLGIITWNEVRNPFDGSFKVAHCLRIRTNPRLVRFENVAKCVKHFGHIVAFSQSMQILIYAKITQNLCETD